MDLTKSTISQHYEWPNLRDGIRTHIKVFKNCQNNKKQNLRYVKLPAEGVGSIPRDRLLVDIIGAYKFRRYGHEKILIIKAATMIDPENGWFETIRYKINRQLK